MEETLKKIGDGLSLYGVNILAAAAIFFIGKWAVGVLSRLLERLLEKAKVDPTLGTFAKNLSYIAGMTFVVLASLAKLGIQTASFVAVLGAAGLAVGLALQGSLSNFAAGVLIVLFKPYKVGDVIEAAGNTGKVEQVQIFNTVLSSCDNVCITVPNAQITGGSIKNFSTNATRRIDMKFGVSYSDDLKKVRQVIEQTVAADARILKTPECVIAVAELADNSVNFVVRPWVKAEDYWNACFDLTEKIKLAFDKNGISIPFPQRDVHIIQQASSAGV